MPAQLHTFRPHQSPESPGNPEAKTRIQDVRRHFRTFPGINRPPMQPEQPIPLYMRRTISRRLPRTPHSVRDEFPGLFPRLRNRHNLLDQ